MYQEHAPPRRLAPFLECIWTTEGRVPPGAHRATRVLPDGCMDVLFNVGDPPLPDGCPHHALRAYAVGAMPTAQVFGVVGQVALVGARLRPGAAPALLPFAAHEARGGVVPLEEAWGACAWETTERVAAAAGPYARVRVLAAALEGRLDTAAADPLVARSDAAIRRTHGAAPVAALAARAGTTVRSLERRYAAAVGLTPKEAARVARFRVAVQLLERPLPLARVAFAAGYADQAHLTREVRALAGVPPAALRRERVLAAGVASVQDGGGRAS